MDFHLGFQSKWIDSSAFIAANATITGQVKIGPQASVWFGAVIRGDTQGIEIGADSNIQDLAVLHSDAGVTCRLGNRVTVGHAAIVHGAVVEDDCLIGMRATLLNHVHVGAGSLIAAGSLLTEGTVIPPGSVVMGVPATVRRAVTAADRDRIVHAADHYVKLATAYQNAARGS